MADAPELEPSPPSGAATDAIEMLLEHLCSLFYRHRWSLKHAFEYFRREWRRRSDTGGVLDRVNRVIVAQD